MTDTQPAELTPHEKWAEDVANTKASIVGATNAVRLYPKRTDYREVLERSKKRLAELLSNEPQ